MGDFTTASKALMDARDQHRCLVCGRHVAVGAPSGAPGSRNHRQKRSHGDHTPANGMTVCGSGTTGCHGWIEHHSKIARQLGWTLLSTNNPAELPLMVMDLDGTRRWYIHTIDGQRQPIDPENARQLLHDAGLTEEPLQ